MAKERLYSQSVDKNCRECNIRVPTNKIVSSVASCTHSPRHRPEDVLTPCAFVKDDYQSFLCSINEMPDDSDIYDVAESDNTNIEHSTGITVSSTAMTAKIPGQKDYTDAEITHIDSGSDSDPRRHKLSHKEQQMYCISNLHSSMRTSATRNGEYNPFPVMNSASMQLQCRLFAKETDTIDVKRKAKAELDAKRPYPLSGLSSASLDHDSRPRTIVTKRNMPLHDDGDSLPYHVDFDAEGNVQIVGQTPRITHIPMLSIGAVDKTNAEYTYRSTAAVDSRQDAELLSRQSNRDGQQVTHLERSPRSTCNDNNKNTNIAANQARHTFCPQPPSEAPRSPQRSMRDVRDSPTKAQYAYQNVEAKKYSSAVTQHGYAHTHTRASQSSNCAYVSESARGLGTPTKSPSPTSIANSNSTIVQSPLNSIHAAHFDDIKEEEMGKLNARRLNIQEDVGKNIINIPAASYISKAGKCNENGTDINHKQRPRQFSDSPTERQCTIAPEDHDRERLTTLRAQARQRISPFIACDQSSSHVCRSRNSTFVSRTTATPCDEQLPYATKPALTLPHLFKQKNDTKSCISNAKNNSHTTHNMINANTQQQSLASPQMSPTKVAMLAECIGDSYLVMPGSDNCSPRKLQNIREWACNAWPSNATEQSANSMNSSAAISAIATQAARELARTPHSQSSCLQQVDTMDACPLDPQSLNAQDLPKIESSELIQSAARDRLALVLNSANRKCGVDAAKSSAPHFTFDIRVDNKSSTSPMTQAKSRGLFLDDLCKGENHSTSMTSPSLECKSYLQSVDDVSMSLPTTTPTILIPENDSDQNRYIKHSHNADGVVVTHQSCDDSKKLYNDSAKSNSLNKNALNASQGGTEAKFCHRHRNLCKARLQDFMLTPTSLAKDIRPTQQSSSR